MPQQERQLALAVLRQEVLHVHLLDLVGAVGIDLRRHAARREHDLLDRLAGDLDQPAADMERAHVPKKDGLLGGRLGLGRRLGCAETNHQAREHDTHRFSPCTVFQSESPLGDEPFLDDVGDLRVVLVLHQHVRIALDADLREVDHVDRAAAGAHRGGIFEIDLLVRRPARVLIDIVAEHHQDRRVLEGSGLAEIAGARRLDRDDALDLVRPRFRDLQAERAALAVQQQHARADLVDQRDVGRDDGVVGRQPARHRLLHVIVVGLDRELAPGQHRALGRIGVPRTFAGADAKALERVGVVQEDRLAGPHVGAREARAAALDRIRDVRVPALADEHVEPAFAAVRRDSRR